MSDNIILKILSLMESSRKNTELRAELLEHYYNKASKSEQYIIDTIIKCICGSTLEILLNKPKNIK